MVWHLENQCMKLYRYHWLLPSFRRTMRNLDKFLYGIMDRRRKVTKTLTRCLRPLCSFLTLYARVSFCLPMTGAG